MPQELEKLLEQAAADDSVLRGRAAEGLGELGGAPAEEKLCALLEDKDVIVRFKAAVALAWLGNEAGAEVLAWALGRTELCFTALQAVTELGSKRLFEPVRRFFSRWHLHPLERVQAAAALLCCGGPEGEDFLRGCLKSDKPEERGLAIELWGRLKMPGALDLLRGILNDSSETHRMDAARGLAQLGDKRSLQLLDRVARQTEDGGLVEVAA